MDQMDQRRKQRVKGGGGGGGGGGGERKETNSNNDASNSNSDASKPNNDAPILNNVASTIQFLYTNAQSLVNKIDEMRVIVANNKPDVLIITETWTNDSVSNDYLRIPEYDIIKRQDRNDTDRGRGGGIIMYAKRTLFAWRVNCDTTFNQCAMMGVKLNRIDLHVMAVYRSPNSSGANDDELCEFVRKMNGTYVIFGDFNLPDIRW